MARNEGKEGKMVKDEDELAEKVIAIKEGKKMKIRMIKMKK